MRSIFFSVLGLAILVPVSLVQAGFGVSPGTIEENKLVPGAVMERTIYLVQGNQTEDITIHASVESQDIADWITIKGGNDFVIPAGVQQFPLNLSIRVPKDASLGIYKAFIRVSTLPKRAENSQITVALGGKVTVNLTVGDDLISEFSIRAMKIMDVREGDIPKVSVTVLNTGNVPAAPDGASFELFNKYGNIRLAYAENNDDFEKVPAFEEGTTIIRFPIDIRLGVGEYWGYVKIYSDGKVIKELKTIFNVTEKSFVENNLYSVVAIAAILILIITVIWRRISRRR